MKNVHWDNKLNTKDLKTNSIFEKYIILESNIQQNSKILKYTILRNVQPWSTFAISPHLFANLWANTSLL